MLGYIIKNSSCTYFFCKMRFQSKIKATQREVNQLMERYGKRKDTQHQCKVDAEPESRPQHFPGTGTSHHHSSRHTTMVQEHEELDSTWPGQNPHLLAKETNMKCKKFFFLTYINQYSSVFAGGGSVIKVGETPWMIFWRTGQMLLDLCSFLAW